MECLPPYAIVSCECSPSFQGSWYSALLPPPVHKFYVTICTDLSINYELTSLLQKIYLFPSPASFSLASSFRFVLVWFFPDFAFCMAQGQLRHSLTKTHPFYLTFKTLSTPIFYGCQEHCSPCHPNTQSLVLLLTSFLRVWL